MTYNIGTIHGWEERMMTMIQYHELPNFDLYLIRQVTVEPIRFSLTSKNRENIRGGDNPNRYGIDACNNVIAVINNGVLLFNRSNEFVTLDKLLIDYVDLEKQTGTKSFLIVKPESNIKEVLEEFYHHEFKLNECKVSEMLRFYIFEEPYFI